MDMLVSSALEAGSCLPSFFEMFMTQQVDLSLRPAARHAHMALAARWPQLHRLNRWFDEGYLLLILIIESRFLARQSCLMSESFYGLRRCRYGPVKGSPKPVDGLAEEDAHLNFDRNGAGYATGQGLRARDRRKALLTAAILPYLFAKLDAGHEREKGGETELLFLWIRARLRYRVCSGKYFASACGARRSVERQVQERQPPAPDATDEATEASAVSLGSEGGLSRARRLIRTAAARARARARRRLLALRSLFFQVYPLLKASYEGSCLVYQWLYLFRRSAFFSPTLRLTGMVVRRATYEDWEEDAQAAAAAAAAAAAKRGGGVDVNPVGAIGAEVSGGDGVVAANSFGEKVGRYARVCLVAAVVGFKIAEWLTRVEAQEGPSWRRGQLPQAPPPPQAPRPSRGGCGVPADSGACPSCGGARTNPTLCAASGFVFCYRCLLGHVREHGECPVTGLDCTERDVVRLYDDEEAGTGG